jgi:DNA-binding transcriptional regulator PaaX
LNQLQKTAQDDAEIVGVVKQRGKITGYGVVTSVKMPETTVRYRLRRLVEMGKLDCHDDGRTKTYSLPKGMQTGRPQSEEIGGERCPL